MGAGWIIRGCLDLYLNGSWLLHGSWLRHGVWLLWVYGPAEDDGKQDQNSDWILGPWSTCSPHLPSAQKASWTLSLCPSATAGS